MSICLFLSFWTPSQPHRDELSKLTTLLQGTTKIDRALMHTAASATDPYLKDEAPPALVLQIYFRDVEDLEAAVSWNGQFAALGSPAEFPGLSSAKITQQAMMVRAFAVPEPGPRNAPGAPYCTYLVSYEGEAEDINAWLGHYLDKHIAHMARFPGIRELEVCTRLDWVSPQPWTRVRFMQRNKVAFDSPEALTAALHSPVRHEMRADFQNFPPFTGPVNHFAMATHTVRLST
jgi:uncharacterized protein (TIGR02118 family)